MTSYDSAHLDSWERHGGHQSAHCLDGDAPTAKRESAGAADMAIAFSTSCIIDLPLIYKSCTTQYTCHTTIIPRVSDMYIYIYMES